MSRNARTRRPATGCASALAGVRWAPALIAADPDGAAGPIDPVTPSSATPRWTQDPSGWRSALDLIDGWRPAGSRLVHRDLHPGNALLADGAFSGLVDCVHARGGPIEADVSRCRFEVAVLAGLGAADDLLQRCADVVPDHDHRWDLLVAAELATWSRSLPGFNAHGARLDPPTIRRRLDQVVAAALAKLVPSS